MLDIILIDDDDLAISDLTNRLLEVLPSAKILDKVHNVAEGVKSIRKHKPSLVFCDIEMPGVLGIDILNFFNEDEITFDLIFVTSHSSFAVRAFQLSAVDYLLKPLDTSLLEKAIQKVIAKQGRVDSLPLAVLKQNLQLSETGKLVLPQHDGFNILLLKDILYLKADNAYTEFVLKDGKTHLASKNIKIYDDMLKNVGFMRVHRSFIVNIAAITSYIKTDGSSVMLNHSIQIPVSSEKREQLLEAIKGI